MQSDRRGWKTWLRTPVGDGLSKTGARCVTAVGGTIRKLGNSRWLFPLALAATCFGTFFDCVGPDAIFAYRDAAHFYPPVYELVWSQWKSGQIPLWNPLLNCGQPLAGVGTAGVFYPPQLVLTCLFGPALAVNLYGILHLAFAAWGSYLLSRKHGCSRVAATVAGLGYGFSGSLFFQVYNPIFAAGAAWLVWAVLSGHELIRRRRFGWFLGLAGALAATVLAGDPQAAYHAGVVLGLLVIVGGAALLRNFSLFAAAAACASCLCLVQLVATARFIGTTSRGMDMVPQSVWQIPEFLSRSSQSAGDGNWYDIIIGQAPAIARHYRNSYSFAVAPWRIVEILWPGFSGPVWSRWSCIAGLETTYIWTASLYAGGILAVSACAAMWWMRSTKAVRSWTVIGLFALWASFGGYAGVGLVRNLACLASGDFGAVKFQFGDEVGSAYWFMATFAPGYSGFRYPAKWLPVFALAMAQLGGLGLEFLSRRDAARVPQRAIVWLVASAAIGLVCGMAAAAWATNGRVFVPGGSYGKALIGVILGLVQMGLVLGIWVWLCRSFRSVGGLIVLLLVGDLVAANRRDIVVGRHDLLLSGGHFLQDLKTQRLPAHSSVSPQVRLKVADLDRPLVTCRQPNKYLAYLGSAVTTNTPWLHRCGVVGERGTAVMADFDMLTWQTMSAGVAVDPRRVYDLCSVEFFVIANDPTVVDRSQGLVVDWTTEQKKGLDLREAPAGRSMPAKEIRLPGDPKGRAYGFLVRNEAALPRVRVVRNAVIVPAVTKASWQHLTEMVKRIAFPNDALPDLRNTVVIEQPEDSLPLTLPPRRSVENTPEADECRIVVDEPQRVVIDAVLNQPGYLVFADTYAEGWRLRGAREHEPLRDKTILRANRVQRACALQAGRHRLEFTYQPAYFPWSSRVTLVSWCLLGMTVGLYWRAQRTNPIDCTE